MTLRFLRDVLIAGAGPAGSAASLVLTNAGRRVSMVDDVCSDRRKPGESLPGAATPLLRDFELLPVLVEGGHMGCHANLSAWGSAVAGLRDRKFLHVPGRERKG